MSTETKQVTVSGILADLENGLTRKDIKQKYDLSMRELQHVFQHPKLKFKKTKQQPNVEVIDDTEEAQSIADNDEIPNFD